MQYTVDVGKSAVAQSQYAADEVSYGTLDRQSVTQQVRCSSVE